jgi:hypothetical protein
MNHTRNPFEYDAAPNLDPKLLIEWFIEDYNHSRFLQSTRNVLINGQRGSGKSMALIFNSVHYQNIRAQKSGENFPGIGIGIYVPCNTPLTHKQEYKLLPEVEQAILSEHFFVYGIGVAIAKGLAAIEHKFASEDINILREEFSYILSRPITPNQSPFLFLRNTFRELLMKDQQILGVGSTVNLSFETTTFYTLILPILAALKETALLRSVHISLLIDDAHDLNSHQRAVLNSWLGYRDHSVFSFKVAIAGIRHYDFKTAFGGSILEGHDYVSVDLDQPFQNDESDFGKFAREVVEKRLKEVGIEKTADDFFPEGDDFASQIEKYTLIAEQEAIHKGLTEQKAITDYKFKYGRALYFRSRDAKANRPQYAGFSTLAHLSTGVIRNLLEPCYWMYEKLLSSSGTHSAPPQSVPAHIQSSTILDRSDEYWGFIRTSLSHKITGCSETDAGKIANLFTALCAHFAERLKKHESEPRVISFSISAYGDELRRELEPLLHLAEKAQLIFVRSGPKKKGGGREDFYILNRMLLPAYGLDAHGQHGRASIQAKYLLAATMGKAIPLKVGENLEGESQGGLFDE